MGIPKETIRDRDIVIDYDFEGVMFRYESSTRRIFRAFYGEAQEHEDPHDNRLLNDAIQFGHEADVTTYTGRASEST
jgi:hypothetical protein